MEDESLERVKTRLRTEQAWWFVLGGIASFVMFEAILITILAIKAI